MWHEVVQAVMMTDQAGVLDICIGLQQRAPWNQIWDRHAAWAVNYCVALAKSLFLMLNTSLVTHHTPCLIPLLAHAWPLPCTVQHPVLLSLI